MVTDEDAVESHDIEIMAVLVKAPLEIDGFEYV